MKTEQFILQTCGAALLVVCGLGCRAADENPDFKESSRVFAGTLDQVIWAISNAFGNGAYHLKGFEALSSYYLEGAPTYTPIHVTNMWDLDIHGLPLTLLQRGKKVVAYDEAFVLRAEAVAPDLVRVRARPTGSGTRERRYEMGMHLTGRFLGGKYLPPLPFETTNLFLRIERQLTELKAGRTNALPATPDTKPGYYRRFWTEMTVEEKHDRRNWERMVQAWKDIQEGHNPQVGASGGHPLSSETNRTPATAAPPVAHPER